MGTYFCYQQANESQVTDSMKHMTDVMLISSNSNQGWETIQVIMVPQKKTTLETSIPQQIEKQTK